jgi:hypothetical protein
MLKIVEGGIHRILTGSMFISANVLIRVPMVSASSFTPFNRTD